MCTTKKLFLSFSLLVLLGGLFSIAQASTTNGTIESGNHTAQVCEDTSCTVTSTSPVNFGYFTTSSASNVHVQDSGLTGFIWGTKFGWAVLNCADTTSGCSGTNGNFKVVPNSSGVLSGYAWGENAGWINFGPFSNSSTAQVTINASGEFNGYAWAQNAGWIKFNCSDASYCVKTDYVPSGSRGTTGGGGGSSNTTTTTTTTGGDTGADTGVTTGGDTTAGDTGADTAGADTGADTAGADTGGDDTGATTGGDTTAGDTGGDTTADAGTGGGDTTGDGSSGGESGGGSSSGGFGSEISQVVNDVGDFISKKFADVVPEGVKVFAKEATQAVAQAKKKVSKVIDTPQVQQVTEVVSTTGAIAGATVSVATGLFANPLSFSELFLIPARLWALLMALFGLRKRNRPWGTVYDSITKQPLDPAYVVLQDANGDEVSTSITDLDGRYGFLVSPGTYKLVANKTNYVFPSVKMAGQTGDELYNDLYFGDLITVTQEGEIITKNIPMDPLKFDWNEFAKQDKKLMRFYSRRNLWIARFSAIFFYIGFAITTVTLWVTPKSYNYIMFGVYCLLFLLKRTVLKPRPEGFVSEKATGIPLPFAIIRIFQVGGEHEFMHKITNKLGKFYCLIPNGMYTIKVERKNDDETYTLVHTSDPIEVKKGYLSNHIEV